MGVSTFIVGNKSVILVDCSYKTIEQIDEIRTTLRNAKELIASSKENSVYLITDVTNTKFNPNIVNEFGDFATSNTKYIKVSVIVGVNESNRIIYNAIKKLTKRNFVLVNSLFEAKKYISSIIA